MFLDTEIVFVSKETAQKVAQFEELGVSSEIEDSDLIFKKFRTRLDDIKKFSESTREGILTMLLYDEDDEIMIRDSFDRIKNLMDDYYAIHPQV